MVTGALVVVLAFAGCGSGSDESSTGTSSPPPARTLAELRARAGQMVDGTPQTFAAQIAALKGRPIVVNQWASWCGPCRFEFPFLQKAADKYRGRVAFLGDNAQDSRSDAEAFLKSHQLPYPHFFDQDGSIARSFRGGRAFPTTAFYDASGKLTYVHTGVFPDVGSLNDEIDKYALHG